MSNIRQVTVIDMHAHVKLHQWSLIYAGSFTDNDTNEQIRESAMMHKFDHQNVLPLIGICLDAGPSPYIVSPFMENGILLSYVKKDRCSLLTSSETEEVKVAMH